MPTTKKKTTKQTTKKPATRRPVATRSTSDGAVKKATGRTWAQWLSVLDRAGARSMSHKEIVAVLANKHPDLGGWWTQMVTVEYEQARGLRDKHEKPGGYEIGATKTVGVPVTRLYRAWRDLRTRRRWLDDAEFEVRKATADRSMRITWGDGRTHVNVTFTAKGTGKSQVSVQHGKLAGARDAERKKTYWRRQLVELKTLLEG
jgi:uncharacterized protein YndB with AHSA1/START domain